MKPGVLVVNDSRFERMVLGNILEKLGYEPILADEYEAETLIAERKPAVALVNLHMESAEGDEFVKRLFVQYDECKFVLTSSSPEKLRQKSRKALISDVLETPTSEKAMAAVMDRVTDAPRSKTKGWGRKKRNDEHKQNRIH